MGKISVKETETQTVKTIVGVTLTALECEIEMGEPKTEELSVTKGFTDFVIVEDIEIVEPTVVGISELLPDSVLNINPEIQKIDSVKKVPVKNDCDSTSTDPVTFINY